MFTYKLLLRKRRTKLQFSKFKMFVPRSVIGELQLTQISLNFQTSGCSLKIRRLVARLCVAINFERSYEKEFVLFTERKYKFYRKRDSIKNRKSHAQF